jgi:hypothetical protein
MTSPALTLVPSNTALPSPSVDQSGPTPAEKKVIAEYVRDFKKRGFCKLDNSASNVTRLFNRFTQEVLPMSFVENDFNKWLYANEKQCVCRSVPYITYTLPHVIGSKFIPQDISYFTHPDTGCTYVNTYRKYKPSAVNVEVSPLFLEYLERLFAIDQERHISVQWLAHQFQHPEQRPSWHLMLLSEPGTGKGFLVQEILHPLMHHTSVVADYSKVMGRFSGVLQDNLLVLLDDCKARTDATQTQLKSILSEERAYVEKKNLDGGMVDTFTRFILASNEHKPLTLEATERRWYVPARLVHKVDRHETQAFIQSLADWLKLPGSLDAVYHYFMAYPLEGFNYKNVPDSDGLLAIVGMSKSPYADFLDGFVREHKVFTYRELVDAIGLEGLSKPGDAHLVHLLREVGYEKTQPRIDGNQTRLCHPIGMTLEEKRAAYKAETTQPAGNQPF